MANANTSTSKATYNFEDLLAGLNQYKAKTEEEIKAAAQAQVNAEYDAAKLNAQQQADQTTLALQQQLESLAPSYDRQLQESQRAYDQAYSQIDRQALSRGMQRSSYNAQTLANLLQEGSRAAGDIQAERTAQEANINANISQTAQQLAEQLAQLETARASDLKAAEDAIRDDEYTRSQAQNELLLNLYQLAEQYGHTEETPSAVSSGGGSTGYVSSGSTGSSSKKSGSGSSGTSSRTSSSKKATAGTGSDSLDDFMNDLFGDWNGLRNAYTPTITEKWLASSPLSSESNGTSSKRTNMKVGTTGTVSRKKK